ncbi:acyl-CoA dehydrogenase family protein [Gordonia sp. NB41Y]|uniref:acyl-CoA dehydrogenase family protein n=1 Tax=Gordonia sp. NB41Y TaxID=875808 RepID=UPI00273B4FB2|nr:acyl-CoA dehydrogenase family protein [Gordonia sp. NB41Y]WLP89991.1 acyl-CoA dehydrogenase family protein [Gordonia sp. NB41Y]
MDFDLTAEQQLLADGLSRFLATRYGLEESRKAAKIGAGWQPEVWRAFADELGVLGACLPESVGGDAGGPEELMVVTEALGAALVVEPFVDTVVLGARLLARTGHPGALQLARRVVDGDALLALAALEDGSGGVPTRVTTTATRADDGWVLDGAKPVVTTAPLASHLIVVARLADTDDLGLFLVPAGDDAPAGLGIQVFRTVDDRRAADVAFDGVRVGADALVVSGEQATALLEQAWDEGTAAVVSEAVGLMRKVLADTVEYTKQRQQFGRPLAGFQALAHRMVDMYIELEQAVAAQYLAVLSLDAPAAERASAVSAAKATISRAARFIGQNSVQLHGGMGMTEELAIGHYFRRLTVIENEFGSADAHLARFERLARA